MNTEFCELKKKALEKYFSNLNSMQQKAAFKIKGPLLILAGAGSGKTTVLINRIANMIFFGDAYYSNETYGEPDSNDIDFLKDYIDGKTNDDETLAETIAYNRINPWNIMAITFTNKAAGELKERLAAKLGDRGQGIMAATFHSACVRILRRECEKIGFEHNFTIYDSDDSLRTIKSVINSLDISKENFPPRAMLSEISHQKDKLITPEEYLNQNGSDFRTLQIAKIYKAYQQTLKKANAMDFDDIICKTIELFEKEPDVLDHYQNLYKYIMVDEFQDTNKAQLRLVSLLSQKFGNICVVGDDDQSIYKFRGAEIENILNFEKQFDCNVDTDIIKLEQNYRSTQNILTCANKLIKSNNGRRDKNLWTDQGEGEKVTVYKSFDEKSEADFVADTILGNVENGGKFKDHAILYRMNAQSNSIEQAFIRKGIPYKIIGGLKFYDRLEIKDVLAYLSVIDNYSDMLRLRRVINQPKRGIGETTVNMLEQISSGLGKNPIQVMLDADRYLPIVKKAKSLKAVGEMFCYLKDFSENHTLEELLDEVLDKSGYAEYWRNQGDEGADRLENIAELKTTMSVYEKESDDPTLSGFLEEISLFTDLDNLDPNDDYTVLMTIHSAKGLEFPVVFVVGMEENIFPSSRNLESESELEEERRLAYVAITRAKEKLYLTYAQSRMMFGRSSYNMVSRFIKELPKENIEREKQAESKETSGYNTVFSSRGGMNLQRQLELQKSAEKRNETVKETFAVGDRVVSKIFGEGTILSLIPMASDTILEIAFDERGTKKMMASFAKIKKIQ